MPHNKQAIESVNPIVKNLLKLLRLGATQQDDFEWDDRRQYYDTCWGYYTNDVYFLQADGGIREIVNKSLGNAQVADLTGIYNPTQRIVDSYENIFRGEFGEDMNVDDVMADGRAVKPMLVNSKEARSPVGDIFRWSRWNVKKNLLTKYGACLGTVGVRIVAATATDTTPANVRLQFEHPGRIKDLELDEMGNVVSILLEYDRLEGALGEERTEVRITETLTKTEFSATRDDKPWNLFTDSPGGPVDNALVIVPYIMIRHNDIGDDFGLPAFHSSITILNIINALAKHIQIQIHRHVRAKWLVIASGKEPTEFDMSDLTVAYINQAADAARPVIQPMVANLNLADATAVLSFYTQELHDRQPELKATDGKFLAQQSGDSISQLREPAEQRLLSARNVYEEALIGALKIALVWGDMLELWDLGEDITTGPSAVAALTSGNLDFRFTVRSGLPVTATDDLIRMQGEDLHLRTLADVSQTGAEDLSRRERMRIRGYEEEEIKKIIEEARTQDVIPDTDQ